MEAAREIRRYDHQRTAPIAARTTRILSIIAPDVSRLGSRCISRPAAARAIPYRSRIEVLLPLRTIGLSEMTTIALEDRVS